MAGDPIPDRIANKPRLQYGLQLFLDVFFDLNTERQVGMGVSPIPWSSIDYYACRHGMTGEMYEDVIYFVRRLDEAYLESVGKRNGNST